MKGFVERREEFLSEAQGLSRTVSAQISLCMPGHSHHRRLALAALLVPHPELFHSQPGMTYHLPV